MNVEFAQAYEEFKAALALDPDFKVALVCMAGLTTGETKKAYAEKAVKFSTDKTEDEKLFASTLAAGNIPENKRPIWVKLHEMFPDGGMITFFYVFSLTKPAISLRLLNNSSLDKLREIAAAKEKEKNTAKEKSDAN